jgi:hypothetical protein
MPNQQMEKLTDEQVKSVNRLATIFRTNGYDPEVKRHVTIKDAMDIQNAAFLIPQGS